jgi:hypothetical protein
MQFHRVLLFWFYLNKQTNQQTNKVVRRREAEFLAVGMRAVRHRYDTFHWKWTSPDIHQIEKLRVLGISRYKHNTKIWSNLDFYQDSFWVSYLADSGGGSISVETVIAIIGLGVDSQPSTRTLFTQVKLVCLFVILNTTQTVEPQKRFHSWRLSFTPDGLAFSTKTARKPLPLVVALRDLSHAVTWSHRRAVESFQGPALTTVPSFLAASTLLPLKLLLPPSFGAKHGSYGLICLFVCLLKWNPQTTEEHSKSFFFVRLFVVIKPE